jgi:ribosomal protein S18 acetylase RimI-like enzyme
MTQIKPINLEHDLDRLLYVIQESFSTVAKDFGLTEENAPTNPAFLKMDKLKESITHNVEFYIAKVGKEIVGCVGIQPGKSTGEYYIERLAVLPHYRHNDIGKKLLEHAIFEIKKRKVKQASIGIINENNILKEWYKKCGFKEYGTTKIDYLPFTVCFMGIGLVD